MTQVRLNRYPCCGQDYAKTIGQVGEKQLTLPEYLRRPWSRIDDYITILQDLLRYTAKAQQNTGKLEQAIEMMMDLKKQADDLITLDRITGYPSDLSLLGPFYRHVSTSLFHLDNRQSVLLSDQLTPLFVSASLLTCRIQVFIFRRLPNSIS